GARAQSCGVGLIKVEVPADPQDPVALTATPRDAPSRLTTTQAERAATLVGLDRGDVAGAAFTAGCGLTWLYLRVTPTAVSRARAASGLVVELGIDSASLLDPLEGVCVYADLSADGPAPSQLGGESTQVSVNARVFVPGPGVPEDPATGSAAAGLGLVLVASGSAAPAASTSYQITQGVDMGRPSLLSGTVEAVDGTAVRCRVAGQVVAVASGTIAIPPSQP
ncbi:MAG: PhzF family phenazine biosynthesis protein, partial [Nocardioidaceae bacterium]|nr:PhzF family phenazine biosynthesis protein [Nocardioidaceae bacterium]